MQNDDYKFSLDLLEIFHNLMEEFSMKDDWKSFDRILSIVQHRNDLTNHQFVLQKSNEQKFIKTIPRRRQNLF